MRERVTPGSTFMILDFTRVPLMDVSAAMAVETVTSDAMAAGRQLITCGANATVDNVLESINSHHPGVITFDNLHDALVYVQKQVKPEDNSDAGFKAVAHS